VLKVNHSGENMDNEIGNPLQDKAIDSNKKVNRPWFKKKRFVIPGVIILLSVISSSLSGEPDVSQQTSPENSVAAESSTEEPQGKVELEPEVEEEAAPAVDETDGEENARRSAESYLRFSAFSRDGLIGQLEFEGFSLAEAVYAVDALNADWYLQAVLKAESYLEYSSFSRQGLIDQLLFEGFTDEEATLAVDQVGLGDGSAGDSGGETLAQQNAVGSAESYLRFSAFSRQGLIDQLVFEDYSREDAVYAVDKVDPDWFEQAVLKAESYLAYSSFSRQGLIDQLLFEGFTQEEAVYGVEQNGY
jgi:colicin import membrane protein